LKGSLQVMVLSALPHVSVELKTSVVATVMQQDNKC